VEPPDVVLNPGFRGRGAHRGNGAFHGGSGWQADDATACKNGRCQIMPWGGALPLLKVFRPEEVCAAMAPPKRNPLNHRWGGG
jgi:hypothetical protein